MSGTPRLDRQNAEDEAYYALRECGFSAYEVRVQMGLSLARGLQLDGWWGIIKGKIRKARPSMPPQARKAEAQVVEAEAQAEDQREAADERYAGLCRAAGGFWWLSERRSASGQPIACLPLVRPNFGAAA